MESKVSASSMQTCSRTRLRARQTSKGIAGNQNAMTKSIRVLIWIGVAIFGALALGTIALHRGEEINAMWLVLAAFCTYSLGYRFYSSFISAKVLELDARRATPAERFDDGRDLDRKSTR